MNVQVAFLLLAAACWPMSALAVPPAKGDTPQYKDCLEVFDAGEKKSKVYSIYPEGLGHSIEVYCDMKIDSYGQRGWTIISKNVQTSVPDSWDKTWAEYKSGWGSASGNYYIGNDNIYYLTNQLSDGFRYKLNIEFVTASDDSVVTFGANYFRIDDEANKYRVTFDDLSSDPEGLNKHLTYHNGSAFSTWDNDNDLWTPETDVSGENVTAEFTNCAKQKGSGFWHNFCMRLSPMGKTESYCVNQPADWRCGTCLHYKNSAYSCTYAKSAVMKILRVPLPNN